MIFVSLNTIHRAGAVVLIACGKHNTFKMKTNELEKMLMNGKMQKGFFIFLLFFEIYFAVFANEKTPTTCDCTPVFTENNFISLL